MKNNIIPNDNITTVQQLKQYVGQYVVCYYYKDYNNYAKQPNLPLDEVSYMWMFKLTQENLKLENISTIRYIDIYGENQVCLVDAQHKDRTAPYFMKEKGTSTAQAYIRTPTKEEMNTYRHVTRHRRIFGY